MGLILGTLVFLAGAVAGSYIVIKKHRRRFRGRSKGEAPRLPGRRGWAAQSEKKRFETSKKIIFSVLLFSALCVASSYLLAFFGRDPLESLSTVIVTSVIAVILGYFLRAFFGKYHEEKNKLARESQAPEESEEE